MNCTLRYSEEIPLVLFPYHYHANYLPNAGTPPLETRANRSIPGDLEIGSQCERAERLTLGFRVLAVLW